EIKKRAKLRGWCIESMTAEQDACRDQVHCPEPDTPPAAIGNGMGLQRIKQAIEAAKFGTAKTAFRRGHSESGRQYSHRTLSLLGDYPPICTMENEVNCGCASSSRCCLGLFPAASRSAFFSSASLRSKYGFRSILRSENRHPRATPVAVIRSRLQLPQKWSERGAITPIV